MQNLVPYKIVDCSFRSDGSGRLYGYKIPADWQPRVGQKLKVPDSSGEGWKAVVIVKLDGKEIPNIPYKWALELMEDEPSADPVDSVVMIKGDLTRELEAENLGGALIGKDLAADLAQPEPQSLKPGQTDEW